MYPGEHAKTRWDDPAFIMATSGETVTFRQYDERANQTYLSADEVAYTINDSESPVVVTSAAKREVAMQLPELCPKVERWLMADRQFVGFMYRFPGPELERELIAFCRVHLAHCKAPRTIDSEAELPRLPTGKLYKRLLRDHYWEGRGTSIV